MKPKQLLRAKTHYHALSMALVKYYQEWIEANCNLPESTRVEIKRYLRDWAKLDELLEGKG